MRAIRPGRATVVVITVNQRDERFGRDRRLRSSRDYARVRRAGRSVSGTFLILGFIRRDMHAAPDTDATQPGATARVGFTVGKRVGGAVTRNRVRRHLREAARRRISAIEPGWDLVVIARPTAAAAASDALAHEIDALLARAKVLKAGSERATV